MKTRYQNEGSVRGVCGHFHRTLSGCAACWHEDMSACTRVGGYSDRYPVAYDTPGSSRQLNDTERAQWDAHTAWRRKR